jgi:carbamoyltransferase
LVCTPLDAFICFMRTEMDYLVMGSYLLDKRLQAGGDKPLPGQKDLPMD